MTTTTATKKNDSTTAVSVTRKVSSVKLTGKQVAQVKQLRKLRSMVTEINKEKEAITEALKLALGDADAGVYNNEVVVEQSRRSRKSVDTELLETNFIEAYNATVSEKGYIVLK